MRIAIGTGCVLFLVVACGGSSTSDPGAAGGSGASAGSSGTAGSGGGSGSGGSGAIGGSGATAGTGGSGGVACHDFLDETPPSEGVTVRLVNARSSPIYLGGDSNCGPVDRFQLDGPSGQIQLRASGCGHTCEALQQHDNLCPELACMIDTVVMIAPGAHYDTSWSGTTFEATNMPNSCYFNPEYAPATCERERIAPAGEYQARARAFTELICLDVGICPCDPGPSGTCEIGYEGTPSGDELLGQAQFEFPSASLVEITFH